MFTTVPPKGPRHFHSAGLHPNQERFAYLGVSYPRVSGEGPTVSNPLRKPVTNAQNDTSQDPRLLYDRKGAAHMLSLPIRSIDYFMAAGVFKTRRVGRKVLIAYAELVKFAARDHCERRDQLEAQAAEADDPTTRHAA
jgi:hypothetical protein